MRLAPDQGLKPAAVDSDHIGVVVHHHLPNGVAARPPLLRIQDRRSEDLRARQRRDGFIAVPSKLEFRRRNRELSAIDVEEHGGPTIPDLVCLKNNANLRAMAVDDHHAGHEPARRSKRQGAVRGVRETGAEPGAVGLANLGPGGRPKGQDQRGAGDDGMSLDGRLPG